MKELTKKCIGLISSTLVQLGQTKTDKDILILASTLAEDLVRDWKMLSWRDVEESFRSGIRESEEFALNVKTYYKWLRTHKKLIDEDVYKQNNLESYTIDRRLKYRSKNNTGLLTIKKLIDENTKSQQTKKKLVHKRLD
tara:strand:+ start:183 stop:599 length:417 start_codon:yes stop_codon:yes gene_type:complete